MLQKPVTDLLMEALSVSRKFQCCFVHVLQKKGINKANTKYVKTSKSGAETCSFGLPVIN